MSSVLLVIHLLIALALIGVILLQKSEGGALGIGGAGAGGMGGLLSGRSAANIMTRTTAILAACFIASSLGLTLIADKLDRPGSIADDLVIPQRQEGTGGATKTDALDNVFSPPVPE